MIEIFAIDSDGNRKQITDLYWFEEEGVHDWGGQAHYGTYTFEIFVDRKLVWKTQNKEPINYMPHTW